MTIPEPQFPAPGGGPQIGAAGAPAVPVPPPGAYAVPVGGYPAAAGAYQVPSPTAPPSRRLGALALVAGLLACFGAPIIACIIALQIGMTVLGDDAFLPSGDIDFSALAPVRTEVLWLELTFWAGTALGLFALVGGIIAIARRRGRGMGIAALVLSLFGPGFLVLGAGICVGIGNAIAFPLDF